MQFDDPTQRALTSSFFHQYGREGHSVVSFPAIHAILKIYLLKCTPNRDWPNLTLFLLSILRIERNTGIKSKPGYVCLTDILKDHYIFKIEEFWSGSLKYMIRIAM
jgi:hypothetical protein